MTKPGAPPAAPRRGGRERPWASRCCFSRRAPAPAGLFVRSSARRRGCGCRGRRRGHRAGAGRPDVGAIVAGVLVVSGLSPGRLAVRRVCAGCDWCRPEPCCVGTPNSLPAAGPTHHGRPARTVSGGGARTSRAKNRASNPASKTRDSEIRCSAAPCSPRAARSPVSVSASPPSSASVGQSRPVFTPTVARSLATRRGEVEVDALGRWPRMAASGVSTGVTRDVPGVERAPARSPLWPCGSSWTTGGGSACPSLAGKIMPVPPPRFRCGFGAPSR
jgi:hypothetical protein